MRFSSALRGFLKKARNLHLEERASLRLGECEVFQSWQQKLFNIGSGRMLCLLVALLWIAPGEVSAFSVKATFQGRQGCRERIDLPQAQENLRRYRLTTRGAKPEEVIALGTGLAWLDELNGGALFRMAQGPKRGYPFVFQSKIGKGGQKTWGIIIKRNGKKNYGSNIAQLIHELGHWVGNRGAYSLYSRAVGGRRCKVSSYSLDRRYNEQFAEMFAAFVTNPSLIRDNPSPVCQRAWKFFSTQLFKNGASGANACLQKQGSQWVPHGGLRKSLRIVSKPHSHRRTRNSSRYSSPSLLYTSTQRDFSSQYHKISSPLRTATYSYSVR